MEFHHILGNFSTAVIELYLYSLW